jgi:ribosomal-protein-alanine N-acetyltransferase
MPLCAPLRLTTPRLLLRPLIEADAPELVRLNEDPVVWRFTGNGPIARPEVALRILREVIFPQYARGVGRLAVETADGGLFLGWCGLEWLRADDDGRDIYDLGFRLHADARGQGFATEAARAVLEDARVRLGPHRVVAHAHPENLASERVLEKVGLRKVGEGDDDGDPVWLYA